MHDQGAFVFESRPSNLETVPMKGVGKHRGIFVNVLGEVKPKRIVRIRISKTLLVLS